jgi:pimeloyl-ACP methyl ester carboxylesterase
MPQVPAPLKLSEHRRISRPEIYAQRGAQEMTTYAELDNLKVRTANGLSIAYRDTGGDGRPVVLFIHFRGNLDNWDPALVDALAANRRVIAFDYEGVGGSDGDVAHTIADTAAGALRFLDGMNLGVVDLLGFSIGSFVAQEVALVRPSVVNRVVLASSAPKGAPDMHGWAADVIGAVGTPQTSPEEYISVFFAPSEASKKSGAEALGRMYARQDDRDVQTDWKCRLAQYDAVCEWGIPNNSLLERVQAIDMPVFVANGDSDPMILPRYSYLLTGLLPDARLKIYPDAAHGFLFQHHDEFASDVNEFLNS